MKILEGIKLAPYTTFKIGGEAKYFCEVKDQFDALTAFEFAQNKNLPVFILGGGSNVLISDEGFNGLVVRIVNQGIEVIEKTNNLTSALSSSTDAKALADKQGEREVLLKVASGENWDSVVEFAVKNNWWGIENLSHIPGSTGAIAVQNVGAYGQEAKNVIVSVTVFDTETHQILELQNETCGFAYRSSIFNTTQKGRYIIFYITFKLSKVPNPILSYRDLFERNVQLLSEIRKAVINIRDKKFPFPTEAKKGNAGSFFKNLVINNEEYEILKNRVSLAFGKEASDKLENKKFADGGKIYPPSHKATADDRLLNKYKSIKVPTAFLLEICGLKDLGFGGAAINHNQPLVIINKTGKAASKDVLELAKKVRKNVFEQLGVHIKVEPELIGFSAQELGGIM